MAPAKGRPGKGGKRPRRPEKGPTRALVPVVAGGLWALALIGALSVSSLLTAVVLIPTALIATVSGLRATEPRRPARSRSAARIPLVLVVALAGAALDPLAALIGPYEAGAMLAVSVGAVSALVVGSSYSWSARPLRAVGARLTAGVAPAVAVTSVMVARHQGAGLVLAMVCATLAYDAGAFLMGHSRTPLGGPVGVVFGVASVAVVGVFVAAVTNPPFSGSRPVIVFALLAAAAPAGVRLGSLVSGTGRLPALRRLDSWLLVAPLWVLMTALLLHR